MKRRDGDAISERVRAVWMARERSHARAGSEQPLGDVSARVAEGSRYDVNPSRFDVLDQMVGGGGGGVLRARREVAITRAKDTPATAPIAISTP
jgi:hypothetical protein